MISHTAREIITTIGMTMRERPEPVMPALPSQISHAGAAEGAQQPAQAGRLLARAVTARTPPPGRNGVPGQPRAGLARRLLRRRSSRAPRFGLPGRRRAAVAYT